MKKKTPAVPRVRPLRFPLEKDLKRNWLGDQALTDLFHGLSLFFPDGERNFIETVRNFAGQITDPELKKQVAAFMKQEAYHGREHERYNRMLKDFGYPVDRLSRGIKKGIDWTVEHFHNRRRLAGTCASEHFTAVLADAFLADDSIFDNADPLIAALWKWHAVEELEHKAVAYDVYQAVGGTYFERTRTMAFVTAFFGYGIYQIVSAMMRTDGIDPAEGWNKIRRFLFVDHKIGWRMLHTYIQYYKPGFHPWEHDNRDVIETWNTGFDALRKELRIA